ncbi:hypothetical protein BCR35DRAFT_124488 [Leucosporidium creatinivorum]|uniref:Uncharacterized protein n=1 Tax=Leucosporidium creatinivorum TaxID=106004 RepID=A0A1Y2EWJ0_9BASI|nr:hypothetical protein BCR35DRAFT_124488 [Leucosporidium creatinivorum]
MGSSNIEQKPPIVSLPLWSSNPLLIKHATLSKNLRALHQYGSSTRSSRSPPIEEIRQLLQPPPVIIAFGELGRWESADGTGAAKVVVLLQEDRSKDVGVEWGGVGDGQLFARGDASARAEDERVESGGVGEVEAAVGLAGVVKALCEEW